MYRKDSPPGFSLIELSVAIIIIFILVAAIVPSFLRSQQRAIGSMARANLDHIRAAQTMFHAEHQTFSANLADLQGYVRFNAVDDEWTYSIPSASTSGFTARAARNAGRPFAGFTITISATAGTPGSSITYSAGTSYPP